MIFPAILRTDAIELDITDDGSGCKTALYWMMAVYGVGES